MSKLLLNFAFATTLYSEKRNYLETFSPFVLKALYDLNKVATDEEVCKYLHEKEDLKLPTNTLKSILRGLSKEGYVSVEESARVEWRGCIIEKGKKYFEENSVEADKIRRKHNEFFNEFFVYLKDNNYKIEFEKIEPKVLKFINDNLHHLAIFNLEGSLEESFQNGFDDKFYYHLTTFIAEAEQKKPNIFETFEVLIKGAILWGHIANKEEMPEKESAFESLVVYLDANIILSLLELHHSTINNAAMQLLNLLKEEKGITLRVLSITLEEIGRLLKTYKNQYENYNVNIAVNSVFYFLKQKGYNELRTNDLINNLDKKIADKGIFIEKKTLLEYETLSREDRELYSDLYTFNKQINDTKKNGYQKEENALHLSTLHDSTVISYIKHKRGAWVKTLERSKAIFLTSSFRLDEFCNEKYKKTDNFPEVILDLTLTNILWLKNPKRDFTVQLHKLIAVHSKRFLVDNGIWKKFTVTLRDLHKEGKLTAQQYAVLFSSNQLTVDYLHNVKSNQINLESLTELSKKIETEILKDKSAKQVKDIIIQEKVNQIIAIEQEIEAKKKEIEQKDALLDAKQAEIGNISQTKDQKDIEIENLKSTLAKEKKRALNEKRELYKDAKLKNWKLRSFIPLGIVLVAFGWFMSYHSWNFNFLSNYINKDTPEHIKTLCSIGIPITIVVLNIFVLGHIYMRYFNESNIKAKYDRIKLPDSLKDEE